MPAVIGSLIFSLTRGATGLSKVYTFFQIHTERQILSLVRRPKAKRLSASGGLPLDPARGRPPDPLRGSRSSARRDPPPLSYCCVVLHQRPCNFKCWNKKAELSQRRPCDAPNIWVPWKISRVLTTPTATFPEICNGFLFRSILRMCVQNLKFVALPFLR